MGWGWGLGWGAVGGRGQLGGRWAGGGHQMYDAIVMHAVTMKAYTIRGECGRVK